MVKSLITKTLKYKANLNLNHWKFWLNPQTQRFHWHKCYNPYSTKLLLLYEVHGGRKIRYVCNHVLHSHLAYFIIIGPRTRNQWFWCNGGQTGGKQLPNLIPPVIWSCVTVTIHVWACKILLSSLLCTPGIKS